MVYVSGIIVYNVYDGVSGKKEEEKNMCQVGRVPIQMLILNICVSFHPSFLIIDGENVATNRFLFLSVRNLIPSPLTDKHGSNGAQVSVKKTSS